VPTPQQCGAAVTLSEGGAISSESVASANSARNTSSFAWEFARICVSCTHARPC
jgi:hypothetical protein